jgi:hypothetical protein
MMAGFFNSSVANELTRLSGYLVDWSRVGELLAQGTHRYSQKELIQRGAIVAATGVGGIAGYYAAQLDEENHHRGLYSMAGCFIGFVVSHSIVIVPLIQKRWNMNKECQVLESNIFNLLSQLNDYTRDTAQEHQSLISNITGMVANINKFNLADDKHAKASQTLGARKRMLENVYAKLNEDINGLENSEKRNENLLEMHSFWSQNFNDVNQQLKNTQPTTEQPALEQEHLKLS